jgi:hypothetical protein
MSIVRLHPWVMKPTWESDPVDAGIGLVALQEFVRVVPALNFACDFVFKGTLS